MNHWSFYQNDTGILSGQQFSSTDVTMLPLNTPEGHTAIPGHHDALSQRVDIATGEVVDYQPPQPSTEHEWDEATRRWRLNAEASGRAERKAIARARISHLEANVQPRAVREVALNQSGAVARLQAIDDEIADLRKQLAG